MTRRSAPPARPRLRRVRASWSAALAAVLCAAGAAAAPAGDGTVAVAVAAAGPAYRTEPGGPFTSVLAQAPNDRAAVVDVAPFSMREEPVTVAEYQRFLQAHPQWRRDRIPALYADPGYLRSWQADGTPPAGTDPRAPVTEVSWFAARAYCGTEGARLPTWLEWEQAAAADETRADARQDPAWQQRILSWYSRPAGGEHPMIGGPADVHGVRDLHGLVWEWVDDWNALFIAGDSRTQGDADKLKFCGAGALAIIGRDSYAVLMRVAFLSSLTAADTARSLGFRCVRPAAGVSP